MFKNASIYQVTQGWPASLDVLEAALQLMPFVPGGASQEKSVGWVEPRGQTGAPLVESVQGQWLLRFMQEVRSVPASAIARRVQEQANQIEATTGRKPGKKEKRDLKEDAVAALLPQAFPRQQGIGVWLDTATHRMVIDSTSSGQTDDIITALVKLLDSFCAEPLQTQTSPAVAMASWLTEQVAPAGWAIGKECELKSADESQAVVRYVRHTLLTDEVKDHITAGKLPTRLALQWDDRVNVLLSDTLQLKKIIFEDVVIEQGKAGGQRSDDFDGNVIMLTQELGPLISDLIEALDGLQAQPSLAMPARVQATGSLQPETAPF